MVQEDAGVFEESLPSFRLQQGRSYEATIYPAEGSSGAT